MKVKVYVINEGTSSQYYGLKNAEENQVLYSAPNNWKTERGAKNWAKRNGFEVVEEVKEVSNKDVEEADDTVKFEIGSSYEMGSVTNHETRYIFKVVARTVKTITLSNGDEIIKCRINTAYTLRSNAETVFPFGKYSMCPILKADNKIKSNIIPFKRKGA